MSNWSNARVFLSSTFRDMHAERDHLIKVTFPSLREKLLPYRVELHDIDLRWGITEDDAKNDKVVDLCLDQIDKCQYFLAFLGQRYGWVPGSIQDETKRRFSLINRFPGVSVTELEIRHGTLKDPNGSHSLILLRKQEAIATIPVNRQHDFIDSDSTLRSKLDALKSELEGSSIPVQPYSAVWDPKRYDRVNHTEGKLDGLDYFGILVEDWLWDAIRQKLKLPETPTTVDSLDAEADLHARFLEMRTRIFEPRQDLYRQLSLFAKGNGETPLLLSGVSGLGKSAALAHFVLKFRKDHPDFFVLPHFVGASPRTTSLPAMLNRITDELQRKFNLTLSMAETPEEIIRTFMLAITTIPKSGRVVLVLDGLDQLDTSNQAESLIWLPKKLPSNVRVLCSSATGPQKAPPVLIAFGKRGFVDVQLQPLTDGERFGIIRAVPSLVAKTLDDKQIEALLANPATRNPLFLIVALEELRGYGSFEYLKTMIDKLPRNGDVVVKLFDQVFERLEQEFNKTLVTMLLRLLACARRGLSGRELEELTQNLGEQADDLYPVLRQLRAYLQLRDGLYDFYHTSIRRAAEIRYLEWHVEQNQSDPWARWEKDRQSPTPTPSPNDYERKTRSQLVDYWMKDRFQPRATDELLWQLCHLQEWNSITTLLSDMRFFEVAWELNAADVRLVWSLVKQHIGIEPISFYKHAINHPQQYSTFAIWQLTHWAWMSGYRKILSPIYLYLIDEFRRSNSEKQLQGCLGNQAAILNESGVLDDLLQAMVLLQEQAEICRQNNDKIGLATSLGNQGVNLKLRGDMQTAYTLFRDQEALCRDINDSSGVARSLGNQALLARYNGQFKDAMELHLAEYSICLRLDDVDGYCSSLINQSLVLREMGNLFGALMKLQEAREMIEQFDNRALLANCLGNIGVIHSQMGNIDIAYNVFMMANTIYTEHGMIREAASTSGNLGMLMKARGDFSGALTQFKIVEKCSREENDVASLVISLINQASVLAINLSKPREGLPLAEEALRLATNYNLIALAQQIEPILKRIRG